MASYKLDKRIKAWLSWAVGSAKEAGFRFTVTSAVRDEATQRRLYGLYGGISPVAQPGRSQHEFGYAVDIVCNPIQKPTILESTVWIRQQYQAILANWWKESGGWWDTSDPVHFALYDPTTWAAFLETKGKKKPLAEALPFTGLGGGVSWDQLLSSLLPSSTRSTASGVPLPGGMLLSRGLGGSTRGGTWIAPSRPTPGPPISPSTPVIPSSRTGIPEPIVTARGAPGGVTIGTPAPARRPGR